MPSIIAELGYVIERHFKYIGIIGEPILDEHQQKLIEQVRKVGGKSIFPLEIRGRFSSGNNFPQLFLLALLKF